MHATIMHGRRFAIGVATVAVMWLTSPACLRMPDCELDQVPVRVHIRAGVVLANGCPVRLLKHPHYRQKARYDFSMLQELPGMIRGQNHQSVELDLPGDLSFPEFNQLYWNIEMSCAMSVSIHIEGQSVGAYGILLNQQPEFDLKPGEAALSGKDFTGRAVILRSPLGYHLSGLKNDLKLLNGSKLTFSYYHEF